MEEEYGELVCPSCGSHKIQVFPGLFVDRYMCKDCGKEWR